MMTYSNNKVYLVTGANIGLGLDATRQLALKETTKRVYLASRTKSKALNAIDDLVKNHNIAREKLVFVPFDASAEKAAILQGIHQALPAGEQLDGLIFNAGGMGHDNTGIPSGPNHILDMVQINLLGHIHLLDGLIINGFLKAGETTIVYSGSENARGIAFMGMAPPTLPDSSEEYTKIIDGSAFKKFDSMGVYTYVKSIAALYWSAWARENPEYHVLTVSPGMTKGTNIASHASLPKVMQIAFPIMMKFFGAFGMSHPVSIGAKRYVDAVTREGEFEGFESGTFVASVSGASGRVGDQTYHRHGAMYGNVAKQNALYQVIRAHA